MSKQSGHSIVAAMNSRTVLIRPGLLADGLGGSAKAGQAVFVRDGVIAAVGPLAQVEQQTPPETPTMSISNGCCLTPGSHRWPHSPQPAGRRPPLRPDLPRERRDDGTDRGHEHAQAPARRHHHPVRARRPQQGRVHPQGRAETGIHPRATAARQRSPDHLHGGPLPHVQRGRRRSGRDPPIRASGSYTRGPTTSR